MATLVSSLVLLVEGFRTEDDNEDTEAKDPIPTFTDMFAALGEEGAKTDDTDLTANFPVDSPNDFNG